MSERRRTASNIAVAAVFGLVAVINLLPLAWGILTSLKSPGDILSYPPKLFDFEVTFEHYARIFQGDYGVALRNSVVNSLTSVLVGVSLAALAAFGFDRYHFRFRSGLFVLVIAGIPLASGAASLIVPNYIYFTFWGLSDKWTTLPIIYTAYNLPMAIWILKGSINGIPRELDEAAAIDGCSPLGTLIRIILPLCKPALGAAAMFIFIGSWNEFVAGSVLVSSPSLRPIQVAIYQYIGFFGREWGPLTASAVVAVLPVVITFGFLGRLFISGLTQGSVKG